MPFLTTTCYFRTRDFYSSFCSSTTETHAKLEPRALARHLSPQSTQAFDQQPSKTSHREEECSERTMTCLTEELILQKTKSERLESVRNLNVWGCALEDLSILKVPPRATSSSCPPTSLQWTCLLSPMMLAYV